MKILGLHFGHDAGVALIEDGRVKFLAHAERLLRKKKALGLSYDLVRSVLDRAGIKPGEIDFCAITTTQGVDIVLDSRRPFRIEIARHPKDTLHSALAERMPAPAKLSPAELRSVFDPGGESPKAKARRERRVESVVADLGIPTDSLVTVPSFNRGLIDPKSPLAQGQGLRGLGSAPLPPLDQLTAYVADFNFPATLMLDAHSIPAAFVSHHAAHAASVFYQSRFNTAAIMTLDGGSNFFEGGLFWVGYGNWIVPLRAHFLELGRLYLNMAHNVLKLGGSAEGKMMGLAPTESPYSSIRAS